MTMTTQMTKTNGGGFRSLIEQSKSRLAEVAPQWMSVERLTKLALAAQSRNPMLAQCTAESYLLFCLKCAETGLEPIGAGGAWAIPFKNKNGTVEVQFIPDWRGLIFLAKKSEQIKHAYGKVVYENDEIDYEEGDTPKLTHKPKLRDRGEPVAAYCVVVLPDDSKHIEMMSYEEIEAIRKRSRAGNSGPWMTDWAQMAIKTVVRRALKPFAASPQMQTAIEADNGHFNLAPEPIAMPKAKEPVNVTPQSDATPQNDTALPPAEAQDNSEPTPDADDSQQQESDASEPPAAQDDGNRVETVVVEVKELKSGKTKAGKPWTLFGVVCQDGNTYKTFSSTDAGNAQKGDAVVIEYETDERGNRDIKSIAVL
jgi:recombination protein RecT